MVNRYKMKETHSAGGVVLNSQGEVLVVSQNGDSWSLPKGHLEKGEDDRGAAEREIREESGLRTLRFVKELGRYERPKIALGGRGEEPSEIKLITVFLFRTSETALNPTDPSNPVARWVKKEEVAPLLTHPKDKAFFLSIINQL